MRLKNALKSSHDLQLRAVKCPWPQLPLLMHMMGDRINLSCSVWSRQNWRENHPDLTCSLASSTERDAEAVPSSVPAPVTRAGSSAQAPFTRCRLSLCTGCVGSACWAGSVLRAHTRGPGNSRELAGSTFVSRSEGWVSNQCSLLSAALFPAGKGVFLWPGWTCNHELI